MLQRSDGSQQAPKRRSDMDESRIMHMGGSFGGYMPNWFGTQTDRPPNWSLALIAS